MNLAKLALMAGLLAGVVLQAGDGPGHSERAPERIELRDQYDAPHRLVFPTTNLVVLAVADREGSEQVDGWINALKARYGQRLELRGLADVGGVPAWLRPSVRKKFQERRRYPVMMDWNGRVCAQFGARAGQATLLVIASDGRITARGTGPAREPALGEMFVAIDSALRKPPPIPAPTTPRTVSDQRSP